MPQMSAASFPLTLEGRTFYMSPLDDRDIDELTNWLQAEIVATARRSLTADMDADERQELLGSAVAYAATLTYGEPKSKPYVGTIKGVARMIYQGLLKRHKNLSFDEFRGLMKTKDSIDAAMLVWTKLNVMQKHQDAGGDGQPPAGETAEQGGDLRDAGGEVQVHAETNQPHDPVPAA